MLRSGFVLAGGRSSRMGRDKALLPYRGTTLLEYIARIVEQAACSVAVIGDPNRYAGFVFPVLADTVPDCGPAGGIYTALQISKTDWNLIVACDMPELTTAVLLDLWSPAETSERPCVAAVGPNGDVEPLCAVYHKRCLPILEQAIRDKRLRMRDIVAEIGFEPVPVPELAVANVNTPADWAAEKL